MEEYSLQLGQEALRTGKIALLALPASGDKVEYRYDDTNPEGRTARMLADRAIQRAARSCRSGAFGRPHHARGRFPLYRFSDSGPSRA